MSSGGRHEKETREKERDNQPPPKIGQTAISRKEADSAMLATLNTLKWVIDKSNPITEK